jgi:hypothetical protein
VECDVVVAAIVRCLLTPSELPIRKPPEPWKPFVSRLRRLLRRRGYDSGLGSSTTLVSPPEGKTLSSSSESLSSNPSQKPRRRQKRWRVQSSSLTVGTLGLRCEDVERVCVRAIRCSSGRDCLRLESRTGRWNCLSSDAHAGLGKDDVVGASLSAQVDLADQLRACAPILQQVSVE